MIKIELNYGLTPFTFRCPGRQTEENTLNVRLCRTDPVEDDECQAEHTKPWVDPFYYLARASYQTQSFVSSMGRFGLTLNAVVKSDLSACASTNKVGEMKR